MTNAMDALTDKIDIEPAGDAEVRAADGGPVELADHAAEAWAGVLIDIYEKRKQAQLSEAQEAIKEGLSDQQ